MAISKDLNDKTHEDGVFTFKLDEGRFAGDAGELCQGYVCGGLAPKTSTFVLRTKLNWWSRSAVAEQLRQIERRRSYRKGRLQPIIALRRWAGAFLDPRCCGGWVTRWRAS
jgi:hypothetical protein